MKKIVALILLSGSLVAADFKAGVAKILITPQKAIRLSGYASREHPSEGVAHDLWAKALALEDEKSGRVVIVTTDLIGLPRAITDPVAARVQKSYGLDRSRVLFNSSHTHAGPVVWPNLATMFDLSPEDTRVLLEYSRKLSEDLFNVIGAALGDLAPADLSFGQGSAGFAANRRELTPKGVKFGVNPDGPVDYSVPVLQVRAPDGGVRAILFGYACHNTTLGGDYYKVSGDYAGYAQDELERAYPGATALFFMLCGADQNPNPRGTEELAVEHGKTLAEEVRRVLLGELAEVRPPIRSAFQIVELNFAPHTRETFEAERKDSNPSVVRRATAMLKAYDERHPVRRVAYPVQAIRFNSDLTLLALGGEVVVDYALRAKREFPGEKLVVAGYSNDVMCYIPSVRVLKEGGYEAERSMVYYGQPGPFTDEVEETIFGAIHNVMSRVGAKSGK